MVQDMKPMILNDWVTTPQNPLHSILTAGNDILPHYHLFYEIVYIIDPAKGEEGIAALVEKFKAMVEAEGTLTGIEEWGKRRLAYPINDLPEGYYVLMNCECKPELPAELDRVFKITDGILRSLIVAVEE